MTVFETICQAKGWEVPFPEFRFAPPRKWRFDWAFVEAKVAVEIEGGAYKGHGHRSVGKYLRDMEKYNSAAIAGWRVLRVTTEEFNNGDVLSLLERIFK